MTRQVAASLLALQFVLLVAFVSSETARVLLYRKNSSLDPVTARSQTNIVCKCRRVLAMMISEIQLLALQIVNEMHCNRCITCAQTCLGNRCANEFYMAVRGS